MPRMTLVITVKQLVDIARYFACLGTHYTVSKGLWGRRTHFDQYICIHTSSLPPHEFKVGIFAFFSYEFAISTISWQFHRSTSGNQHPVTLDTNSLQLSRPYRCPSRGTFDGAVLPIPPLIWLWLFFCLASISFPWRQAPSMKLF